MKAASGNKVINRQPISCGNELYLESIEIFFFSLVIAMIAPAFQKFTDWNPTIPADSYRKGVDHIAGAGIELFKTGT